MNVKSTKVYRISLKFTEFTEFAEFTSLNLMKLKTDNLPSYMMQHNEFTPILFLAPVACMI